VPDRIIFAPAANADLEAIRQWIAAEGVAARCRDVRNAAGQPMLEAGRHATPGPTAPEYGEHLRSVAFGSYVILYEVEPEQITILRIVHGARDLTAFSVLRPESE
jgi:toxin ParE1/3/4